MHEHSCKVLFESVLQSFLIILSNWGISYICFAVYFNLLQMYQFCGVCTVYLCMYSVSVNTSASASHCVYELMQKFPGFKQCLKQALLSLIPSNT